MQPKSDTFAELNDHLSDLLPCTSTSLAMKFIIERLEGLLVSLNGASPCSNSNNNKHPQICIAEAENNTRLRLRGQFWAQQVPV